MEHLVESHLGGYYVSNLDSKIITAYCESCGDSDLILLSWDEGCMMEALTKYFSKLKYSAEYIEKSLQLGITKRDAIEDILYDYSSENKCIINNLYEEKVITEEEYKKLLEENLKAQKRQISLVCEIYPKGARKVLKRKEKKDV